MKFRCNLCNPADAVYTCVAPFYDDGMHAMQTHIDAFHDGGEAIPKDITINVRVRHQ